MPKSQNRTPLFVVDQNKCQLRERYSRVVKAFPCHRNDAQKADRGKGGLKGKRTNPMPDLLYKRSE
jgi:hypothetical protein